MFAALSLPLLIIKLITFWCITLLTDQGDNRLNVSEHSSARYQQSTLFHRIIGKNWLRTGFLSFAVSTLKCLHGISSPLTNRRAVSRIGFRIAT